MDSSSRAIKRDKLQEEVQEQYCKLDNDRFLQKPISNGDLVKNIKKIQLMN
jgi:hypothetical protein